MEKIWRDDGTLAWTLTLRETQAGFAGETTTILVIEPDGHFCSSFELNGTPQGERKGGRLDAVALADLAAIFADQDFQTLPHQYGDASPINQRQLVLSFKEQQWHFLLPPAAPGAEALIEDKASPLARILTIRQALFDHVEAAIADSHGACR